MIDSKKEVVAALEAVLPTYYEIYLGDEAILPCITYMESSNVVEVNGTTMGYSRIAYNIKVWGTNLAEVTAHAQSVDAVMRGLGFERTAYGEMPEKDLLCILITYQGLGKEDF